MKFTHRLDINGWMHTTGTPSDFKEVKHLGKCSFDGDMFAAYHKTGVIEIFKGTMEDEKTHKTNTELSLEERLKRIEEKLNI